MKRKNTDVKALPYEEGKQRIIRSFKRRRRYAIHKGMFVTLNVIAWMIFIGGLVGSRTGYVVVPHYLGFTGLTLCVLLLHRTILLSKEAEDQALADYDVQWLAGHQADVDGADYRVSRLKDFNEDDEYDEFDNNHSYSKNSH